MTTTTTTTTKPASTPPTTAPAPAPAPTPPRPSPSLFAITGDMASLRDLMEEALAESGGEITPEVEAALNAWMQEMTTNLEDKADNYAAFVRHLLARAAVRREESERIHKLVAADEGLAGRLKTRLKEFMENQGIRRLDTRRYKITVQANGGKVPIELTCRNPQELPEEFQLVRVEADMDKIRKEIEGGAELPFAVAKPRGSHLRVN